ncbi:MAG: FGGY-family carbohydrate kinase [Elainellaceae cyanobacterium]
MSPIYLGIDFGTSGARAIAIDAHQQPQAQATVRFSDAAQTCEIWKSALVDLFTQLPLALRQQTRAIAINGTSSTVLLCNAQGQPLAPPLLYNDARGAAVLEQVRAIAPANHTVISATSSLAKLLWLVQHWQEAGKPELELLTSYFLHQADWLAYLLHGKLGMSDYHNALKLGYDVGALRYPDWLLAAQIPVQLPRVVAPGTAIAPAQSEIIQQFGLAPDTLVCAGTTDSIAAFLASGVAFPGEAVTSLGSTLVLKLLSATRVDDARYGIYSHRLGDQWLVGGASNTGGAVLQQFFSPAELEQLSQAIDPTHESRLDYYPLLQPGERFPVNDPDLLPRLTPRPADPAAFLHGLLESMARIEARGYQLLQELGASRLQRVDTAGGGAKNSAWTQIRSRHLGVPVSVSTHIEAAYGTALLAKRALKDQPCE